MPKIRPKKGLISYYKILKSECQIMTTIFGRLALQNIGIALHPILN